jgi:hypothetical protein
LVTLATLAIVSITPWGWAQTANRVTQDVDAAQVQALPNHHPQWANASNDAGLAPAKLVLDQMTIVLARSPEQEAAFEKLLADQQNPASPDYHRWLTPAEVGERFGLSEQDIESVTGWLQSQGLHVNWVAPSRIFIGFGGTAADVGRAFQTELHYYNVNGVRRISVSSDPMIPAALVPVIKAIHGLYTIDERPAHHATAVQSDSPEMNNNTGSHFIAPADFDTIYDVPSSLTGAGVTIGIVGRSRVNPADLTEFQTEAGITFAIPQVIVPTAYSGIDPGPAATSCSASSCSVSEDQLEATLDVQRAGSVAPGATLLLVVSAPSNPIGTNGDGIGADAQYLVNANPLPQVINISFGSCESEALASGVTYWNTLFQQAAGEGISAFVSSGDSGAAGCDTSFAAPPTPATTNSPNAICASSYATCAGGTEFNDTSNPSTYWSSSNGTGQKSALSYIPEGAWNEPINVNNNPNTVEVAASGGGVSSYIPTPSWQTGTGVPTARAGRYTPDIAFSAAGHDGYFGCINASTDQVECVGSSGFWFEVFNGTSAAAPSMAGVAALLDQKLGAPQGNLNPGLYATAASVPAAFHDITVATSGVGTCVITTPSMCNNSTASSTATITNLSGGEAGYEVTAGYDEVTGLGSLDVANFIDNYVTGAPAATTGAASAITYSAATLAGTVNPSGTVANAWFLYGTSSTLAGASQTTSQALSGTTAIPVTANLTGLNASTTYYFQAVAHNSVNTTKGAINSFTTAAVPLAPSTTTGPASAVTDRTATLNGTVNPNGEDTRVWFLYGTSSTLSGASQTASQDLGSGTTASPATANLTGLTPSTTYYFQAVAQNATGTTNGAINNFITPAPPFTLAGTAVSVAPGATTGNTSTITVTPSGGFTGTVSLSCAIVPIAASDPATCGIPASVTISGATAQTATLTVYTTAATSSALVYPKRPGVPWYAAGGATLACLLLFGIPARRRSWRTMLGMVMLLAAISSVVLGCGGGGGGGGGNTGTTPGSYVITVTGTSGADTETGTVALTVQ